MLANGHNTNRLFYLIVNILCLITMINVSVMCVQNVVNFKYCAPLSKHSVTLNTNWTEDWQPI